MKKQPAPQYDFHKLSSSLSPAPGRRGEGWWLEINSDRFQSAAICECKPLPPFGPEMFASAEDAAPREDFPYVSDSTFVIVSERARAVMEREAPGNCRFLPVEIKHAGQTIDSSYSIVNCLNRLDCIDLDRSAEWLVGREPQIYLRVVIDPLRVPPSIAIFRVEGVHSSIFIRERVRLAFKKAKLTGWTAWQG